MTGYRVQKLIILIIFICILGLAFYSNVSGLRKHLSTKKTMAPDFNGLCQASDEGGSVLLGSLLYKYYDHQIKFYMPSPVNDNLAKNIIGLIRLSDMGSVSEGNYSGKLLNAFSYPIIAVDKNYEWLLNKNEFEFLFGRRFISKQCTLYRILLIKSELLLDNNEIAMFVYNDNKYGLFVVIAPYNWKSVYKNESLSF